MSAAAVVAHAIDRAGGIADDAAAGPADIAGLGFDATCSLVALDEAGGSLTVSPTGRPERDTIVWMDHRAVKEAAAINAKLGVAYGYPGAPGQWWQQQVVLGLQRGGLPPGDIARLMNSYFELTELHIHPRAQGRGLGEALARKLLANRDESNVLLSTPETDGEPNRAWRLYRRLGFTDVIRRYHFAGDPRAFAILGRPLPL